LILLGIASAHKYVGNLVSKSPSAVNHIAHTKNRKHDRKAIKDITFLPPSCFLWLVPLLACTIPF